MVKTEILNFLGNYKYYIIVFLVISWVIFQDTMTSGTKKSDTSSTTPNEPTIHFIGDGIALDDNDIDLLGEQGYIIVGENRITQDDVHVALKSDIVDNKIKKIYKYVKNGDEHNLVVDDENVDIDISQFISLSQFIYNSSQQPQQPHQPQQQQPHQPQQPQSVNTPNPYDMNISTSIGYDATGSTVGTLGDINAHSYPLLRESIGGHGDDRDNIGLTQFNELRNQADEIINRA